ncbi:MAG: DNA-binding protein, partial [Actinobacteria bacterium]|nr:DNA-binding protein [Actinomycetota bacterium]
RDIPVPLTIVSSAYRDLTDPVLSYLSRIHIGPRDVVQVFIPEYVVGHWWEQVLHNQSALRLKTRLLYMPGVMVTSVPYQLSSAEPFALGRPGTAADAPAVPGAGAVPPPPSPGGPTDAASTPSAVPPAAGDRSLAGSVR